MKKFKKALSLLLALAILMSLVAGCTDNGGSETTAATTGGETGEKKSYTVSVKSVGGMALEGIDVYVYADSTLADLKQYGETDAEGNATVELEAGADYAVTLSGVPEGYEVEPYYSFTGNTAIITLNSALIAGENLSSATLGVGDVMYDFTVTTPAGETITLSEMLKEKELVMLNFWYTTCTWCLTEFPFMEEAYQMYGEDVGIIALNPFNPNAEIIPFQAEYQLTFPMVECPPAWATAFNVSGYPTSVFIDRYGVICMIEAGGITSLRPFTSAFDHFTGDDYEQKLIPSIGELVTTIKPTFTMDTPENVAALMNNGQIPVTYHAETDEDSAELTWPFIAAEKNGESCLKASNQGIDDSYAILYADVELKAGQAVGFDYLASSERSVDVLYVIVNDEDIYQISGVSDPEAWQSCYPCVAEEDGTYEVAICYLKDESGSDGDDTVYIKNMRIVDSSEIDTATYLPREAATPVDDGFAYNYVDIFYNENDGYYHVGSENGPLLLADLMNYTAFNEEQTIYEIAYDGDITVDGYNYYDDLLDYFSFASNSSMNGICTVNQELHDLLKIVDKVVGFDEADENEWMKLCKYYQTYGTGDTQLTDPIQGLAPFSAPEAKLGKNVETNYFYYDRAIIPRGLLAKFVPTKSGVYRITSRSDSVQGVDGWIFDENRQELLVYEQNERMYNDEDNVSMLYYMEAGTPYFIDIAFWDVYEIGYIYYDIEFVASEYDVFRLCSPGYFTYDSDATGNEMYYLITEGVKPVLGSDGYYYEDLGLDANGNQKYGSMIYADFTGVTGVFSSPISSVNAYNEDGSIQLDENGEPVMIKGMIELGGFDFSKTEDDLYVLGILEAKDNDVNAADEYLKALWGEDYDSYAEIYQLDDVFAGRYHGEGEDLSEQISAYLDDIITGGPEERRGCVPVTEELAQILHKLMDKYTFENVDNSWLKLCYYYDHLGPQD